MTDNRAGDARLRHAQERFDKKDAGKNQLRLLPHAALLGVGEVLTHGAEKYAPDNWRKVDVRGRYYDAMLRHAFAWWNGEDTDPDSGLPHLDHMACCALFLSECEKNGYGKDDRPKP